MESNCDGYQKKRVTPYFHIMCFHMPAAIQQHGSLWKFSCQGNYIEPIMLYHLGYCIFAYDQRNKLSLLLIGVEKQNDESKKIYFNSSNKWDAPRDILATDYKLHVLNSIKRTTRKYT